MKPVNVHQALACSASTLAVVGLVLACNAYTAIATYCIIMYCIFPTLLVHETAGFFMAGFVFNSSMSLLATGIYLAAYALFVTTATLNRLVQQEVATKPKVTTTTIVGDDI